MRFKPVVVTCYKLENKFRRTFFVLLTKNMTGWDKGFWDNLMGCARSFLQMRAEDFLFFFTDVKLMKNVQDSDILKQISCGVSLCYLALYKLLLLIQPLNN